MLVNPKKRTKRAHAKKTVAKVGARHAKRRRNPVKAIARRVKRRRNPIAGKMDLMASVKSAAYSAAGALVLDVAYAYLPVPSQFKSGNMLHVGKIAVAFGLGLIAQKMGIIKGAMGRQMVEGAMTVTLHDAGKGFLASAAPSIRLSSTDDADEFMGGADDLLSASDDLLIANDYSFNESPINEALNGGYQLSDYTLSGDGGSEQVDEYMGEFMSEYTY